MLKVKPFSGLYYYNSFSKSNNVSRFVKRAFNFDNGSDLGSDESADSEEFNFKVLQKNRDFDSINSQFKNWLESGILTVSGLPSFYVCSISYKIAGEIYESKGVFAVLKLPETSECKISFLEDIDENSTNLVFDLLSNVNLQTSSVFALYDDDSCDISSMLDSMCVGPCCEKAKFFDVSYKIWEVKDSKSIEELQRKFEKLGELYIIHGREVYDAALRRKVIDKNSNCVLSFFMEKSSNVLAVLPFHRIISMNTFDLKECLKKLKCCFDFFEFSSLNSMRSKMFSLKRENRCAFGLYAEEIFGVLVLKDDFKFDENVTSLNFKNQLDSFVANELIIKKLLNLCDSDLQFTNSAKYAKTAVDNGDGCMALFLNSERMLSLINALNLDKNLPSKAAYVFPNLVDGLIFYSMQ